MKFKVRDKVLALFGRIGKEEYLPATIVQMNQYGSIEVQFDHLGYNGHDSGHYRFDRELKSLETESQKLIKDWMK